MRFAALFVLAPLLFAEAKTDWNSFRGPNGSGVADATNLPVKLDKEKISSGEWRCLPATLRPLFPAIASS